MKRSFLCILLVLVTVLALSGCSVIPFPIDINIGEGGSTEHGGDTTEQSSGSQTFDRIDVRLSDYVVDDDCTATEKASALALTATYELTCTIAFNYVTRSFGWGGIYEYETSSSTTSQGTGFVINTDGYMITNAHVINVENSNTISGFTITSRKVYASRADKHENIECSIIAYDETLDLALLKLNTDSETPVDYLPFFSHVDYLQAMTDSVTGNTLRYGESVIAVGNAQGYGISVTQGCVSAPVKYFESDYLDVEKLILTDAPINPGNSGGPLCNLCGAVVGVNSSKIVTSDVDNMGFAIPSYVVTDFIDSLVNGTYRQTTIGQTHGQQYTGKADVTYYVVTTREYKADGSNVTTVAPVNE